MIIEKIELENFMCYADKCSMEFTEGINVIIGDNGYGKSKLYDAFYWVLYDKVFVPEKKDFLSTRLVKSKIISDKSKTNTKEGRLSATVSITFHNLENDKVYILERKYTVTKKDNKFVESNDSEFTVMEKEVSYLNAKIINDEDEKQKVIERILPSNIKDYLWFQGEQVESIIDFNQHDTLTKAINVLSSITKYDELKNIAISTAKAGNLEYDKEVRRLSKDTDKSEQLEKEKNHLEKIINDFLSDEKEARENLSRAEERCDKLLNKISDATKISEFQQRKKGILEQLSDLNDRLNDEQIGFHKKMFRNKWVLKGTQSLHEDYSRLYSKYGNKKLQEAAELKARSDAEDEIIKKLQTRLPIDVPEPIYVQRMLDEEKCLVCDRDAKKNSDAWKKIKELIDRPDKQKKTREMESPLRYNFESEFRRLYQNGLALTHRIEEIDLDINETLTNINNISSKIKNCNKELKKCEDGIQKLLSDTSQTTENAEHIIAEYSIQNKYVKDFTDKLNKITQQLDYNRNNLKNLNDQLKELVTGEIPKWLTDKKNILNDFEIVASSTRDRVFNKLINQLEKGANLHYVAMTSGNKSARGEIRLRQLPNGNYMPEIIDNNGVPLMGSNTSNLILVKLAAIMAIISAKTTGRGTDLYTLITDAPTSVFGEDYTIGFCMTVSKVYRQSIIMSKEFYKNENLKKELLTNPQIKIGKVYMISPSIRENERSNRNTLSIKIKALN